MVPRLLAIRRESASNYRITSSADNSNRLTASVTGAARAAVHAAAIVRRLGALPESARKRYVKESVMRAAD